ncbi:MAG: hypothetical protein RL553_941 [Planctomycetota bacterium]|jgi:hypothetical protein
MYQITIIAIVFQFKVIILLAELCEFAVFRQW